MSSIEERVQKAESELSDAMEAEDDERIQKAESRLADLYEKAGLR